MLTRSKDFRSEFYFFLKKFQEKENFSLLRFSDGEIFILQNKGILLTPDRVIIEDTLNSRDGFYAQETMLRPNYDQKHFIPEKHNEFRDYLIGSYLYEAPNYYKGISCRCCVGEELFYWQLNQLGGDNDNLTWSNLLLNSNYPLFLKEFYPEIIKRGAYIVCNKEANLSRVSWVKGHFFIGFDIFDNFETYVADLKLYIERNSIENEVFLFSASSLSNVMQYELARDYPNNTYIDIGTTLSHEFGIPVLRGYILDYFNNNLSQLKTCVW